MLKKLLLISTIIFSSAIVLQAQENERHWDEGKISWNDFSGASGISGVSEIRYFLAYKHKILFLNGTLAGSDVKADYMADKNWYKGQRAHLAVIDVSLGYAFVDNAKLKLTPFAGLGITEFSGENKDMEEDELRIVDYNILFGLNADYKLNTRINTRPAYFSGLSESMETSVRARLYISKAHYYDDLKGYTINLTLGICGFGNIIRLK